VVPRGVAKGVAKNPVVPHAGTQTPAPQQPVPEAWQKDPRPKLATHCALVVQVIVLPQEKFSPQAVKPSTDWRHTQLPPDAGVPHVVKLLPQVNDVPQEVQTPFEPTA